MSILWPEQPGLSSADRPHQRKVAPRGRSVARSLAEGQAIPVRHLAVGLRRSSPRSPPTSGLAAQPLHLIYREQVLVGRSEIVADTCAYCGMKLPGTGALGGSEVQILLRIEHLLQHLVDHQLKG